MANLPNEERSLRERFSLGRLGYFLYIQLVDNAPVLQVSPAETGRRALEVSVGLQVSTMKLVVGVWDSIS